MRRKLVTDTVRRYEQLDTFPETIEQELRPADRHTDRLKENYSIDVIEYQCRCERITVVGCCLKSYRHISDRTVASQTHLPC